MTMASGMPSRFSVSSSNFCGSAGASFREWYAMSTSAEEVNSTVRKPASKVEAASILSSSALGIASPVL